MSAAPRFGLGRWFMLRAVWLFVFGIHAFGSLLGRCFVLRFCLLNAATPDRQTGGAFLTALPVVVVSREKVRLVAVAVAAGVAVGRGLRPRRCCVAAGTPRACYSHGPTLDR